jgi:hypothetical protein
MWLVWSGVSISGRREYSTSFYSFHLPKISGSARIRGKAPRQVHVNIREKYVYIHVLILSGLKCRSDSNFAFNREDYYTPSTSLFRSFVKEEIISHYGVESLIEQGTVSSLIFSEDQQIFEVHTEDDRVFFSKAVVMAVGPGAIPNVPKVLRDLDYSCDIPRPGNVHGVDSHCNNGSEIVRGEGWCHTSAFLDRTFQLPESSGGILLLIGGG